jgi:hypothetical protein
LEGNGTDAFNDDFISSSVEMDVYETAIENDGSLSCNGEAVGPVLFIYFWILLSFIFS